MASSSSGRGLRPPVPSEVPSSRSSADYSHSQEHLLGRQANDTDHAQGIAGTVPYAPPHRQRFETGNPSQATNARLVSLTPKEQDLDHNDLTYWPTILEPLAVVLLILTYAATATGIGVLMWKTLEGPNHSFRLSSENVRMISRYFPSIVGTITVLLFRQTVREALRMEPFTQMADQKELTAGSRPAEGVGGAWFPWQNITTAPISPFSVSSLFCQFVVSFIVSFKVALLASTQRVDTDTDQAYWILTLRLWPAGFLIVMYVIMILYTLYIAWHFRGKSTGLKWDPVSIADFASLFAYCNALQFFAPLELRHNLRPKHIMPKRRHFRLGYWDRVQDIPVQEGNTHRIEQKTDVVYGIGVEYHENQAPRLQLERDPLGRPWYHKITLRKSKPPPAPVAQCERLGMRMEGSEEQKCMHGSWPECEHYPYNENPGCSRWIIVFAAILPIGALTLGIYALAIRLPFRGFTLKNSLRLPSKITVDLGHGPHTLPPVDPADPDSNVLLWALLFRSVPTYVAGLFTSTIVTWIDLNMRFMQPFRNMFGEPKGKPKSLWRQVQDFVGTWHRSKPPAERAAIEEREPATAAESILLAYITVSPLQVPLAAWDKKHYKVCVYSTLNTLSPLFPIFVGALFTITPNQDYTYVNFTFSLSAYIGVMTSLALFAILLPAAIPGAYRLLPRQLYSLADLMSLCHQARFMASPHLNIANKKHTPSKEHMEARILLTGDRFLFGVYNGRDNLPHLGFDVTQEQEPDYGLPRTKAHRVQHVPPEGVARMVYRTATNAMEAAELAWHAFVPRTPMSQREHVSDEMHEMETRRLTDPAANAAEPVHAVAVSAEASGARPPGIRNVGRTQSGLQRKPVPAPSSTAQAARRTIPEDGGR